MWPICEFIPPRNSFPRCLTSDCLYLNRLSGKPESATTEPLFDPDIIETNLDDTALSNVTSLDFETEFDAYYGLLAPEQTVLVRACSDDSDDRVLAE